MSRSTLLCVSDEVVIVLRSCETLDSYQILYACKWACMPSLLTSSQSEWIEYCCPNTRQAAISQQGIHDSETCSLITFLDHVSPEAGARSR